jgi:retron-type reverse transcriptase
MNTFDQLLTPEFRERFLERRLTSMNVTQDEREPLQNFIRSDLCTEYLTRLKEGDYFLSVPVLHLVRKGKSARRREVYSFTSEERFLCQLLLSGIQRYFPKLSDNLYSFRKDRSVRDCFRKIRRYDRDRSKYVIKLDIHAYATSGKEEILCSELDELLDEDDQELLNFLKWLLLRKKCIWRDELIDKSTSMMPGIPISSLFMNLYLTPLDRYLDEHGIPFLRYSDDVVIYTDTKEQMDEILAISKKIITEDLQLELNEEKTQLIMPGEEYEQLGMTVMKDGLDISEHAKAKIKGRIQRQCRRILKREYAGEITKEEGMDLMIQYAHRYFYARRLKERKFNWLIWAFNAISTTRSLEDIDHFIQNCIRICGSGKRSNSRYRIRYETMKEHGYTTLVHAYRSGFFLED